jgi:outer membrane protein assembly factor BamB
MQAMQPSPRRLLSVAVACGLGLVAVLGAALAHGRGTGEWPILRLWQRMVGTPPQCQNGLKQLALAGFRAGGEKPVLKPGEWPMFGGSPSRNLVNLTDKDPPTKWQVEGKFENVRWMQSTGNRGYGAPVVAGGRVFVSTNNKIPRDPKVKGHKAIIMCFDEKTGKFLYQVAHEMVPPQGDQQAKEDGMCSTPTVVGDRFYYVTPGCIVVCADVKNGKEVWHYDMMKELKVYPCALNACAPLVVGDTVYVVTANGVDMQGDVAEPKAPSFVALHRKTGKLKWQNNLPGKDIIHGQWGNPAWAEGGGRKQVLFPGGDGYLYSLDPETGKLIWKFQCSPPGQGKESNYLVSTPAVVGDRVYIGIGAPPETGYGNRVGHFWCIDITRTGDVSPAKGDFNPKSPKNKKSALVWHYGGEFNPRPKGGRAVEFGKTMSTAAVHDGLVYILEEAGYLHCLDAVSGKKQWEHDFKSGMWGSACYVAGKVYVASEDGEVHMFAAGRAKRYLGSVDMGENLQSTPVVAGNTLYVTTKSKVFAIGGGK